MGHWARLDNNNIVQEVIVITEEVLDANPDTYGDKSQWVKTSYNTKEGKHYVPNGIDQDFQTESPDQSKALRFRYAGVGMYYDSTNDVFYNTRPLDRHGNPCSSWTLNTSTWIWEAPITRPTESMAQEAARFFYVWDETVYQSDNTKGWVIRDASGNIVVDDNQDGVAD